MANSPRILGSVLAAVAVVLTILDLVLFDPLRWLFRPGEAARLEIDRLTREAHVLAAKRLDRDKTLAAFAGRERLHKNFSGGGFVSDFGFACVL
jgi:hypothetical protein